MEIKIWEVKDYSDDVGEIILGDSELSEVISPYIQIENIFCCSPEEFERLFNVIQEVQGLYKKVKSAKDIIYECENCGKEFSRKELIFNDLDLWCPVCPSNSDFKFKRVIS